MAGLVHIVDDDETVRAAFSFLLSASGYGTQTYEDGAELLCTKQLDEGCILLDLKMPRMDGFQVMEELTRRHNELPVIVMSASGDFPAVVRSMKLGAIDFVEKPTCNSTLLETIDRALESFRKGRAHRDEKTLANARLGCLSPRERQMLEGLLEGLSTKQIARRLGISPRTVDASHPPAAA